MKKANIEKNVVILYTSNGSEIKKSHDWFIATMKNLYHGLKSGKYTMYHIAKFYLMTYKLSDSGRLGKTGEVMVKLYLHGLRGNWMRPALKGCTDVTFHGVPCECKTNCGEINDNILSNDFVIYTMYGGVDYYRPSEWKVVPTCDFIDILNNVGLIREKKSSNGQLKTTIQSYRNSKRKTMAFERELSVYPTLEEWKEAH